MFKKILAFVVMLYAAAAFAAVDVNKASAADLDSVKGIGPAISGKIIEERKKGNFKDWTDFVNRVQGVGEGNAVKLSEGGLTVNGAGFKGMTAAPATPTKKDDKPMATAASAAPAATPAPSAKPVAAASASAVKDAKADVKVDAKAEAKAKKDAEKKAKDEEKAKKAEEAKAKKEAAKKDAKPAAADTAKPAASAASAAKK